MGKRANCSQFATAMAVMARHVGMPARVGVGYLPGVFNPMTGAFTVRAGDAHAWVEVHFRDNGWVVFDPTPRPDISLGPGIDQPWVTFGLLDFVGINFPGAVSSLTGGLSVPPLSMPGWTWSLVLSGVVLAGILAALQVARRTSRTRQVTERYTALEGASRKEMLSTYERMVAFLAGKGLPTRNPAQTPDEYAAAVGPRMATGTDIVGWLTRATDIAAYDSRPFQPSLVQEARDKLASLRRSFALRTG